MAYAVTTRAAWNARSPKSPPIVLPWSSIDEMVVHYSGSRIDLGGDYAARVRAIQNYHMDYQGWNDIAYNWIVSRTGRIFIGRGWNVMGAATFGHNAHTFSICFLGDDTEGRDDVTSAGRKSIIELVAKANDLKGSPLKVVGHRDRVNTDCPGDELMAFIRQQKLWKVEASWPLPLPKWVWRWNEWRYGEGAFKQYGPRNKSARYLTGAPYPMTEARYPWVWAWARRYDANRRKLAMAG